MYKRYLVKFGLLDSENKGYEIFSYNGRRKYVKSSTQL